jgi:hypothetical protein
MPIFLAIAPAKMRLLAAVLPALRLQHPQFKHLKL